VGGVGGVLEIYTDCTEEERGRKDRGEGGEADLIDLVAMGTLIIFAQRRRKTEDKRAVSCEP